MIMALEETLETRWKQLGHKIIIFNTRTNSPRDRGSLTRQATKTFYKGTLLNIFNVLYADDESLTFEDRYQLAKGVKLSYDHFKLFGLEMHIGKGAKSSKTKCVFFLLLGLFKQKQTLPAIKNIVNKAMVEKTRSVRESHKGKHQREEREYVNLPETRLVEVSEVFVTFCVHFKYLGYWLSFSLQNDYNAGRRIVLANALMGALKTFWRDHHIDMYSKYMIFRAIPCNLLLWGCESWTLCHSLLD